MFGPTFPLEMAAIARRKNLFVVRTWLAVLFAGAYALAFGIFIPGLGLKDRSQAANQFFFTLGFVQLAWVLLLCPTYVSESFAAQTHKKTFELLRITTLSNREIVLSKFVPRLLLVLSQGAVGFGIVAIVGLWGGVGADRWLGLVALLIGAAISSGSIAMAFAVGTRRRRLSSLFSYGLVGIVFLGPLALERGAALLKGMFPKPGAPWRALDLVVEGGANVNPFHVLGALANPSGLAWPVRERFVVYLAIHGLITVAAMTIAIRGLHRSESEGRSITGTP